MCTKCELWWVMTKPWTNEALLRVTEFAVGLCRLICSDLAFPAVIYHLQRSLRCFPKCDKSTNAPDSPNIVLITIAWFYPWCPQPLQEASADFVEIWVYFHSRTTHSELFFLSGSWRDTSMLTVCFWRLISSPRSFALLWSTAEH